MNAIVNKELKSKNELYDILNDVITKEVGNTKLIKHLTEKFIKKGLSGTTPNLIFDIKNGNVSVNALDNIELICLVEGINEIVRYKELTDSEFFSSGQLDEYANFFEIDPRKNIITFNKVTKYNDYAYICGEYTLEDMYLDQKNRNLRYNFETQREAKKRKDSLGNIRKSIMLNMESVRDIKESFKEGTYFPPDVLTFNIPLIKGKEPNVVFDEEKQQLIVVPNYDFNSENYTAIDVVDGWHRVSSAYELYKNNEQSDKSTKALPVIVCLVTIDQAREFIIRKSKGNRIDFEHIKSLETGGMVNFINKLNSNGNKESNVLFDQIAETFTDMKLADKFTDKETIRSALSIVEKRKIIDFNKKSDVIFKSDEFTTIITEITNRILNTMFKNDLDSFNNSIYTSKNIWIGYIAIASKLCLMSEDDMFIKIKDVADKIMKLKHDEIFMLKLNVQVSYSSKQIFEYFEEMIKYD